MQISLDGGETWIDAPEGVRVSYDVIVMDEDGTDIESELLVTCTDEGIISDVFSLLDCIATESETAQEIVDRLVTDRLDS